MSKLIGSNILLILLLSMFASAASAHDIEVKMPMGLQSITIGEITIHN